VAGLEVMAIRCDSDHRSELLEQQPKNGLALAFGPAQALGATTPPLSPGLPSRRSEGNAAS
jgi:hypothetical protein